MPLTDLPTRQIVLRTSDAGGRLRPGARLTFALTDWDTDGERVVEPHEISVSLAEDGQTIDLWPPVRGQKGLVYHVRSLLAGTTTRLGVVQPPDEDGHDLASLLDAGATTEPGIYYRLTQADLDEIDQQRQAAEQAAGAAAGARVASETARDEAAASADLALQRAEYYPTIAAGRAAVADGGTFGVVAGGADGLARPSIYRRDSSDSQTLIVPMVLAAEADALRRDVEFRAMRYVVPSFGAAVQALTMTAAGVPVEASLRTDVRSRRYLVPRIGNAVDLTLTAAGRPVAGTFEGGLPAPVWPERDQVAGVAGVDVRPVAGSITGRSVDQVWLRRSPAVWRPISYGHLPARLVSADTVAGSAAIVRDGAAAVLRWRPAPLGSGGVLRHVLIMGQSLAMGHVDAGVTERRPYWRDPVLPERAWQFADAAGVQRGPRPLQVAPLGGNKAVPLDPAQIARLEPLRGARHADNAQYCQTAGETAAAALLGQHLHPDDHVLVSVIGSGSTAIADFGPASTHYANAQAVITAAAAQATARGLSLVTYLVWSQGEEDTTVGTDKAAYKAAWKVIRDGIAARVVSVGGTFGGTVLHQTLERTGTPAQVLGMATYAHAELITEGEALGVMPSTCPPYYSGSTHLLPLTYLPLGSATAYEIARLIAGGSPATPRVASAVLTNATTITCTLAGGNGSYQADTTQAADATLGIRVVSAAGDLAIAGVAISGATLTITISAATDIADAPVVRLGLHDAGASQSRVSIRDTSGWTCGATGSVVSGWMPHHAVTVTAP